MEKWRDDFNEKVDRPPIKFEILQKIEEEIHSIDLEMERSLYEKEMDKVFEKYNTSYDDYCLCELYDYYHSGRARMFLL